MRAWRSAECILVEEGPGGVPVVSMLTEEVPAGPWRDLNHYAFIDGQGVLRGRYVVTPWSVDDDLAVSLHAVVDGELRELTVIFHTAGEWKVRREETVVLGGLREIESGDAEAWTRIREVLAGDRARAAEAAEKRAFAGAARIAALEGALEDFGAGPEFRRAQEVLRVRVEEWGGDLETELLRALGRFGELFRSLGKPLRPAVDEFAIACRLAAFDATLREKKAKAGPAPPSPPGKDVQALAGMLDRLRRLLLTKAGEQEMADAGKNANEYYKAADHLARAVGLLPG